MREENNKNSVADIIYGIGIFLMLVILTIISILDILKSN